MIVVEVTWARSEEVMKITQHNIMFLATLQKFQVKMYSRNRVGGIYPERGLQGIVLVLESNKELYGANVLLL